MLIPHPVVFEQALLGSFCDELWTDGAAFIGHCRSTLDDVQRLARVAAGEVQQRGHGLIGQADAACQAALVLERARDDLAQVLLAERLEPIDPQPGEQWRVDLVVGILGRRPHQGDGALLDVGQECVLLCLVEAVQLVDEDDGLAAGVAQLASVGHQLPDVRDAARHRRDLPPRPAGSLREQAREGGLAAPRRTPQDHGRQVAGPDDPGQCTLAPNQVRLSDELVQGLGAHAGGERCVGRRFRYEEWLRGAIRGSSPAAHLGAGALSGCGASRHAASLGRIGPTKGLPGGYQRVLAGPGVAFDTHAVLDMLPIVLVLAAMIDGSMLYGLQVARRVRQRRIDQRLREAAHLYGLVRVTLAERRAA